MATPTEEPPPPSDDLPDACADNGVCTAADAVANLKEWLPDSIKSDAGYDINRFYSISITIATISVTAKDSNWVRDIMEGHAFDMAFGIIGDLPAGVPYHPNIVIKLRSALDTSYLLVTTPGKYLDRIFNSDDPEVQWRKLSKFVVKGHLY